MPKHYLDPENMDDGEAPDIEDIIYGDNGDWDSPDEE